MIRRVQVQVAAQRLGGGAVYSKSPNGHVDRLCRTTSARIPRSTVVGRLLRFFLSYSHLDAMSNKDYYGGQQQQYYPPQGAL